MRTLKKYIKSIGISFILIIILSFFLAMLNYFNILNHSLYKMLLILNHSLYKMLLILFIIISTLTGSYNVGYNSDNKGYLNGIIYGIVIIIIFIIISLVSKTELNSSSILYYLIVIITSLIGGTIGINKKTTEINQ